MFSMFPKPTSAAEQPVSFTAINEVRFFWLDQEQNCHENRSLIQQLKPNGPNIKDFYIPFLSIWTRRPSYTSGEV